MAGSPRPTNLEVVATAGFPDYALLDSGNGRKLERFGRFTVDRPEPQAMWQPVLEPSVWLRADAVFKSSSADEDDAEGGRWRKNSALPETWPMQVLGVTLLCRLTSFRHLGVFPEQLPHWQWMLDWLGGRRCKDASRSQPVCLHRGRIPDCCARRGRGDARRCVQEGGRVGQAEPGGLQARRGRRPLDHRGCAQVRGARGPARSSTYDFILVDPPKFGRGPEGEVWDVFAHLAPLLRDCATLLGPQSALVLTTYAIRASALAMDGLVRECLAGRPGRIESGELAVIEQSGGRLLPTSMFTRWSSHEAAS